MLIFRVFAQFKREMKGLQDCSKTLKMVYKTLRSPLSFDSRFMNFVSRISAVIKLLEPS